MEGGGNGWGRMLLISKSTKRQLFSIQNHHKSIDGANNVTKAHFFTLLSHINHNIASFFASGVHSLFTHQPLKLLFFLNKSQKAFPSPPLSPFFFHFSMEVSRRLINSFEMQKVPLKWGGG